MHTAFKLLKRASIFIYGVNATGWAKEVGQGPLLPVIPAVANAVYDAVGVRIDETPITPEKVLRAMEARAEGKPARYGPTKLPTYPFPRLIKVAPPWDEVPS